VLVSSSQFSVNTLGNRLPRHCSAQVGNSFSDRWVVAKSHTQTSFQSWCNTNILWNRNRLFMDSFELPRKSENSVPHHIISVDYILNLV
ncbi:unnamed protein product, partial [Larinioides sclopetarius]